MNPAITALLIFGGTVQVIADLIVIANAFGISARVAKAWAEHQRGKEWRRGLNLEWAREVAVEK